MYSAFYADTNQCSTQLSFCEHQLSFIILCCHYASLCNLFSVLSAWKINIFRPFKCRRNQVSFSADHCEHTADTGCTSHLTVLKSNSGLARTDSRHIIGMMRQ